MAVKPAKGLIMVKFFANRKIIYEFFKNCKGIEGRGGVISTKIS